jgi:cellulose synthase/poly-beta-1,6-N-acetylglucosamine synthase-like glycosyltransferase
VKPGPATIVIPVRNCHDAVEWGLPAVLEQAGQTGGSVIVVDDASRDGSGEAAERLGARVIRLSASRGPYVCRNQGWRVSATPIVVFTDARCRPRPGWLHALIASLEADAAAVIAGGQSIIINGQTAAGRWAVRDQRLQLERHLNDGFLPYVPTANLAVRRRTLEALGGFVEMPSGADVDFCWRAQLRQLGTVIGVPAAIVEVLPRNSTRELIAQWRRFGESHAMLWRHYAPAGCPVPDPEPRMQDLLQGGRALLGLLVGRRSDPGVELVEWARLRAYRAAYRRAWRRAFHWPGLG